MSDQLYRQNIIDHYKNPRNVGELENATNKMDCSNVTCGDETEVSLIIKDGKIEAMQHQTRGCAICVAGVSILSEEILGKNVEEISKMDQNSVKTMMGIEITPSRLKCAMLGLEAVKKALNTERKIE